MKKSILLICLLALVKFVSAQDTIAQTNGTKIIGKVTEVTSTEVKYTIAANPNVSYSLLKTSILYIGYSNGYKDIFPITKTTTTSTNTNTSNSQTTTNVVTKKSYTQCVIQSIVITQMSSKKDDGYNWDTWDGSDVYFEIFSAGNVILTTTVWDNLDIGTLPIKFSTSFPFTLPYLNQKYTIYAYDYDDYSSNDGIGGYYFNPADYVDTHPKSVKFTSNDKIDITLNLEWE